jgi:hypothetical protein
MRQSQCPPLSRQLLRTCRAIGAHGSSETLGNKMKKPWNVAAWWIAGPIAYIILAYFVFMLFAGVLGAGFVDIDGKAKPIQNIFSTIALPAALISFTSGLLYSIIKGFLCMRAPQN